MRLRTGAGTKRGGAAGGQGQTWEVTLENLDPTLRATGILSKRVTISSSFHENGKKMLQF